MTSLTRETPDGAAIHGSKHAERVFIGMVKTRASLTQYASGTEPLEEDQYHGMLAHFATQPHLIPLKQFIESTSNRKAPQTHRAFLKDLARNGPVCALLQGTSNEEVDNLISLLSTDTPLFQSKWASELQEIHRTFPLFFDFMSETQTQGKIPSTVTNLILSILRHARKPFVSTTSNNGSVYSPPVDVERFTDCGFFPGLPKYHR